MSQASFQPLSYDILVLIQRSDFFKVLDESLQQELVTKVECILLAEGEYLFRQGDSSEDGIYIILKGHLSVSVTQKSGDQLVVDEHEGGEIIGEIGMLTGSKRTASIKALSRTEVVKITKSTFEYLIEKSPRFLSHINQLALHRLQRPQLISILSNLFGALDMATLEDMMTELTWMHLVRGERLIRQGDIDGNLYILVSGRLQVVASDQTGNEQVIGEITAGESVGEMHILSGEARSASVYGIRDSTLVKLSKAGFDRLVAKYPQMMQYITRLVIKRLQETSNHRSPHSNLKTIAMVPASPDIPLDELTCHLLSDLKTMTHAFRVTPQVVDTALTQGSAQVTLDDADNVRVVSWLNEQEARHDLIIYQAEPTLSSWSKRCIRQADRVLIVAWADANPEPGEVESILLKPNDSQVMPHQELVLLHRNGTHLPSGTDNWLKNRTIYRHHHVRWNNPADIRRMARFVTGRAVGLVLGGGGARGFAHIGVIRAIEEAGIAIDFVGGTSFGALVGAAYALGWTYDEMYSQTKELTNPRRIFDYTLPFTSFLESKKFTKTLFDLFGEAHIEDTWRSFFCVSTNLTQTCEMVHKRGPIWKYIRASTCLPLAFVPVNDNGNLLIDGLLVNNLPLTIMQRFNEGGPIIAVDVSVEADLAENYKFETSLSGWKILWSRLNPFQPTLKTPPLSETLVRIMEFNSVRRNATERDLATLYIQPPVQQFAALDLKTYQQIIDIGYQSGQREIQAWLAKQPVLV